MAPVDSTRHPQPHGMSCTTATTAGRLRGRGPSPARPHSRWQARSTSRATAWQARPHSRSSCANSTPAARCCAPAPSPQSAATKSAGHNWPGQPPPGLRARTWISRSAPSTPHPPAPTARLAGQRPTVEQDATCRGCPACRGAISAPPSRLPCWSSQDSLATCLRRAIVALGTYVASLPQSGALSLYVGRKAITSPRAQLVGVSYGAFSAAFSPQGFRATGRSELRRVRLATRVSAQGAGIHAPSRCSPRMPQVSITCWPESRRRRSWATWAASPYER